MTHYVNKACNENAKFRVIHIGKEIKKLACNLSGFSKKGPKLFMLCLPGWSLS